MRTGYVVNCVQNNVIEDSGIVMMEPNCSLSLDNKINSAGCGLCGAPG